MSPPALVWRACLLIRPSGARNTLDKSFGGPTREGSLASTSQIGRSGRAGSYAIIQLIAADDNKWKRAGRRDIAQLFIAQARQARPAGWLAGWPAGRRADEKLNTFLIRQPAERAGIHYTHALAFLCFPPPHPAKYPAPPRLASPRPARRLAMARMGPEAGGATRGARRAGRRA